jgi:hypothetical protein
MRSSVVVVVVGVVVVVAVSRRAVSRSSGYPPKIGADQVVCSHQAFLLLM